MPVIRWKDGERYTIPETGLQEALGVGYEIVPEQELQDEMQKLEYSSPLIAAGIGAAKEIVPFVGDDLLSMAGLPVEEQELYQKHNPASYTAGQIIPYVAAPFLSGKKALMLGGAGLTEMAGRAIGKKIAPMVAGIPLLAGKSATKAAAKGGLTYGAMGGAEALTQASIDELEALNDSEFTAESILASTGNALSSMGIGGILGGTIGAAGKGLSTIYQNKAIEAVKKEIQEATWLNHNDKLDVMMAFEASQPTKEKANKALEMLRGFKKGPRERLEAYKHSGNLDQISAGVENEVLSFLDSTDKQKYEIGKDIVSGMSADLKAILGDAPDIYKEIDNYKYLIPVKKSTLRGINKIFTENYSIEHLPKSSKNQLYGSMDAILNNVDDLYGLRTQKKIIGDIAFAKSLAPTAKDTILKSAYSDLYFKLNEIEDKVIEKASKKGGALYKVNSNFIDEFQKARKSYNEAYEAIKPYSKILNLKGPKDLRGILELSSSPSFEKIYTKILDEGNYDEALKLKKLFPSGYYSAIDGKWSDIINSSKNIDGQINLEKIRKKLSHMTDKEADILFDIEEFEHLKTRDILDKNGLRRKYIPSDKKNDLYKELTDLNSLKIIEAPPATFNEMLNRATKGIINAGIGGTAMMPLNLIPKAIGMASEAAISNKKIMESIDLAANTFFKVSRRGAISGVTNSFTQREIEEARNAYISASNNPESLIESFERNAEGLKTFPQLYSAAQEKALNASQFLAGEIPKKTDDFLQEDTVIPRSELIRISNFIRAINDPMGVIENIKKGYVNENELKALKSVYPRIYQRFLESIMKNKPEKTTEKQKELIRQLMGTNRSDNDQLRFNMIQQIGQKAEKANQTGMAKINISGRTEPDTSKIFNRRV